jgi:hypothetical protein
MGVGVGVGVGGGLGLGVGGGVGIGVGVGGGPVPEARIIPAQKQNVKNIPKAEAFLQKFISMPS